MKRVQISTVVVIILSVFLICFLMGRAMALKDDQDKGKTIEPKIYKGAAPIPKKDENSVPATNTQEKVKKTDIIKDDDIAQESVPSKMLFPCGKEVLNDYSQTAVRSKTMGDWRAHTGVDYIGEEGENVCSIWNGVVLKVYEDKLWGHCVEIVHTGNLVGKYRNLAKEVVVKKGDKVTGGQVIGKIGRSASVEKAEDPHLHFELWSDGVPINPSSYIY